MAATLTRYATIHKDVRSLPVAPNLTDYFGACESFRWETARKGLSGLPGGAGLNLAFEAVDRHALGPFARRVALRWISKEGEARDYSYADLAAATNRFANVLHSLGVGAGERVVLLMGRIPELYVATFGASEGEVRRFAAVLRFRSGTHRDADRDWLARASS